MALRGTATQSSVWTYGSYPGSPFVASYATDGNFETSVDSSGGTCAIMTDAAPVWWQVDLHKVYEINKIAITGRKGNRTYFKYL